MLILDIEFSRKRRGGQEKNYGTDAIFLQTDPADHPPTPKIRFCIFFPQKFWGPPKFSRKRAFFLQKI